MSELPPRLEVGSKAPDFSIPNQDGVLTTLKDLAGKKAILYFYPAAGSPGCTKEAADFQDHLGEFKALGYEIVGISPDGVDRIKTFQESHELEFALLSDQDMTAHRAFGAFGEKNLYGRIFRGALRSTIVIDQNGVVSHALYNVKATGHTNMLLKKLG